METAERPTAKASVTASSEPRSIASTDPSSDATPSPWNPEHIAWRGFEDGLAEAKKSRKPICLVFYTTWCPHCTKYADIFADARIAAAAKSFVMIRLDRDQHEDLSEKFALDGEYVPRTYFLDADGAVAKDVRAGDEEYRYFYDEDDPESLLRGFEAATTKLGKR